MCQIDENEGIIQTCFPIQTNFRINNTIKKLTNSLVIHQKLIIIHLQHCLEFQFS
jgi:hypothetical protein